MATLTAKNTTRRVVLPVRCSIGRSRACDLEIAEDHVSGQHAAIEWNGATWHARDLGSSNGTFVAGRRLAPGESAELGEGVELRFGRSTDPWILADAGPPVLMAVRLSDARVQLADGGYLALPDGPPELGIYQTASGLWVCEARGATQPVTDREVVTTAEGQLWRVHLPTSTMGTVKDGEAPLLLASLRLCFVFTRDEEHVALTVTAGERTLDLKSRAHHYPLLVLARQRLADRGQGVSEAEQGWVRVDDLLRWIAVDENHLNITVHRARTQLGQLGVVDAAGLIERRPGTRQLRIGASQLTLTPLGAAPR